MNLSKIAAGCALLRGMPKRNRLNDTFVLFHDDKLGRTVLYRSLALVVAGPSNRKILICGGRGATERGRWRNTILLGCGTCGFIHGKRAAETSGHNLVNASTKKSSLCTSALSSLETCASSCTSDASSWREIECLKAASGSAR